MAGIILATSYNFTIPEIGADLREFGTITATGGVGTLRYTISGRDDPDLFELHNGGRCGSKLRRCWIMKILALPIAIP